MPTCPSNELYETWIEHEMSNSEVLFAMRMWLVNGDYDSFSNLNFSLPIEGVSGRYVGPNRF